MLSGKMTTKPKQAKRPADVVSNAVHIMRVLTGEADDSPTPEPSQNDPVTGKNPAAVTLGRMGGAARAAALTEKKRSEIAKKAADARWKTKNPAK